MAAHAHLDDDDDFGGDFPGSRVSKSSGSKRSYGELDDDEDDIFGSKKGNTKVEETGMILSLRESLHECKEALATCRLELEVAKAEIQKWHTSFRNEPFIPTGKSPDPNMVTSYLQALKSSKDSLEEQLEKAKKKEAAFIVTFAKREQEISELKAAVRDLKVQLKPPSMQARRLLLDPAVHEEFTRLKNLVEEKDKKVKELQDSIAAVNFTPQSKMGRLLMLKCKTLQDENEELGNQASEGKIQELTMSLALQKYQNQELRSQFQALYKQVEGLTNDAERSNEMVLMLEEKLEERDDEIRKLKQQKGSEVGGNRTDLGSEEKVPDQALSGEVQAEIPV